MKIINKKTEGENKENDNYNNYKQFLNCDYKE